MFSLCNLLNILLKLIELVKIVVKPIKQKNIKLKEVLDRNSYVQMGDCI